MEKSFLGGIMRKLTSILLTTCMILMSVATTRAGGALETIDITAGTPSPIPGHILARVIGIRWDARSIPVPYKINNTLNPVPNPLGPAFLSVADATTALQGSCVTDVPRWRLRAYVTRPPTGAAAPERLSALRSPHGL